MEMRIKPDTYQYPDLISRIEQGLIKLPAFQRGFIWPMDKTIFLLDSIARRYPIGTFLFWQTTDFMNALRNIGNLDLADPPAGFPVQYVLDGQQRVTSLYAALRAAYVDGQEYSISVDLDSTGKSEEIFLLAEPDSSRFVLVADMLGDDYGSLFSNLSPERQRRFNELRTTFLNYPFSVTLVEGGDLDVVCDLFERINNSGIVLSTFDLLVARTWSPPEDQGGFDLREAFGELQSELDQKGYDSIPEPVIAQLAGAIIKDDCTRLAILQIGREEMRGSWASIEAALKAAVDFLRRTLRIPAGNLLPYPSLLAPIAYFYHRNDLRNPDATQSAKLTRYFYLNGLSWRLSSGAQAKLTEDLGVLDDWAGGKATAFEAPASVSAQAIRDTPLSLGNAYCKSVLCLLAGLSPRDLRDGSAVLLQGGFLKRANSRHFHHIFPKAHLRGQPGAEETNSVANVAYIPEDLNLRIGRKPPSTYLQQLATSNTDWPETLKSHGIDDAAQRALMTDQFPLFLSERAQTLARMATSVTDTGQP